MTRRLIGGGRRTVASASQLSIDVSHAHARTVHGRADAAVFPRTKHCTTCTSSHARVHPRRLPRAADGACASPDGDGSRSVRERAASPTPPRDEILRS